MSPIGMFNRRSSWNDRGTLVNLLSSSTLHPQRPQLRISDDYHRLRNTLMDCELFLIRILGFRFQFNHPNKYLLHYLDTLSKWMAITPATPMKNNTNLIDIAMSILQDTYYDYVLIRDFAPQHVAIAIIYLLIKTYALEIPSVTHDDEHITWMKVISRSKSESRAGPVSLLSLPRYSVLRWPLTFSCKSCSESTLSLNMSNELFWMLPSLLVIDCICYSFNTDHIHSPLSRAMIHPSDCQLAN